MASKLTDEQVLELRDLRVEGVSVADLAEQFEISERHVRRLVHGAQRQKIAGLDLEAIAAGGVTAAVRAFVVDLDRQLDRGEVAVAAVALVLAGKLDATSSSNTAAAAQAAPRLAAELVEVINNLRRRIPDKPDALDEINQRREARRLAVQASRANGGG